MRTEGAVLADNMYVDLSYLASHPLDFKGMPVATIGIVRFYASVYMFEDFFLECQTGERIPVVVRFAGLPAPEDLSLVEVSGKMEYSSLEGGFFYLNASAVTTKKNVILIGWDGVQRNHLFELLGKGALPNLSSFVKGGALVNVTVSDHRTDTKAGWTQILTGYRWWRTGVFNNLYWFHSIPPGYSIPERVEQYFGKEHVSTGFITGKLGHMEAVNGTGSAASGTYTHEAIYSNLQSQVDVVNIGDRNATLVGPMALQFLENNTSNHFFAFFHFSDPDSAGHNQLSGGENSVLYEEAIIRCDYWLGQILDKLNTLNLTKNSLVYVTADHGFDEGGYSHNNAPYVFLATNDKDVARDGDQVDVPPTIYFGLGMWNVTFNPELDGYPLQISLPEGVYENRLNALADNASIAKPTMTITSSGPNKIDRTVAFNASDKNLAAVLLLVDNTLKAVGPWTWNRTGTISAFGSFIISTAGMSVGNHTVKILAFDEQASPTVRQLAQ